MTENQTTSLSESPKRLHQNVKVNVVKRNVKDTGLDMKTVAGTLQS